jgi:hypothetical protein
MKLNIKTGDRWETDDYVSYRASQEKNGILLKYNWGFLSVEIGDIREMSVKNFYAVALKFKFELNSDDGAGVDGELFSFSFDENCTATYNSVKKIFNLIEKPDVDDPMGITTLTFIDKDILQIEYVDSSNDGGPGYVYVANLHKKEGIYI